MVKRKNLGLILIVIAVIGLFLFFSQDTPIPQTTFVPTEGVSSEVDEIVQAILQQTLRDIALRTNTIQAIDVGVSAPVLVDEFPNFPLQSIVEPSEKLVVPNGS